MRFSVVWFRSKYLSEFRGRTVAIGSWTRWRGDVYPRLELPDGSIKLSAAKISNSKVNVGRRNGWQEGDGALQVSSCVVQFAAFAQCSPEEGIGGTRTGIEPNRFAQLCNAFCF